MVKITITMPAYILKEYPAANRQLVWQPGYSQITGHRRFCFLQLGWSGGKAYRSHKYAEPGEPSQAPQPFIVR